MEGYFFFTARLTLVFSDGVPNRETRDNAFLACASFSIGYFFLSGSAKDFDGSFFRAVVESLAIFTSFLKYVLPLQELTRLNPSNLWLATSTNPIRTHVLSIAPAGLESVLLWLPRLSLAYPLIQPILVPLDCGTIARGCFLTRLLM